MELNNKDIEINLMDYICLQLGKTIFNAATSEYLAKPEDSYYDNMVADKNIYHLYRIYYVWRHL